MWDRVAPEKTESLAVFPHNIQGVYGKVVNNMSIAEAKYDGIERVYDPLRGSRGKQGTYVYKIPCEQCGEILTKTQYNRSTNYLCDYCKGLIKKKKQALMTKELESVETKKEKQFRNYIKVKRSNKNLKKQTNSFVYKILLSRLGRHRQKRRCFFLAQKEEMKLDMEDTLARIMLLLQLIHNENMGTYKMLYENRADKIISAYEKQLNEILEMDFDKEK